MNPNDLTTEQLLRLLENRLGSKHEIMKRLFKEPIHDLNEFLKYPDHLVLKRMDGFKGRTQDTFPGVTQPELDSDFYYEQKRLCLFQLDPITFNDSGYRLYFGCFWGTKIRLILGFTLFGDVILREIDGCYVFRWFDVGAYYENLPNFPT